MSERKPSLYYGADSIIFENAKKLRAEMTPSERKLWEKIIKSQLGVRFKPQHPVSNFVVDFYCHKAKLVIEVDGAIHFNENAASQDLEREKEIEGFGLKVVRFTNEQIHKDMQGVLKFLKESLNERLTKSPL